jgi:hypothetical protein
VMRSITLMTDSRLLKMASQAGLRHWRTWSVDSESGSGRGRMMAVLLCWQVRQRMSFSDSSLTVA